MRSLLTIFTIVVAFAALALYRVDSPHLSDYKTAIIQRFAGLRLLSNSLTKHIPVLSRSVSSSAILSQPGVSPTTTNPASASTPAHNTPMAATASSFQGLPVVPPKDPSLSKPENMSVPRKIQKSFLAIEQAEGAGARVRRSIGTPRLRRLSPFLMLDHFSIGEGAGFPDHPHSGQETITYLLQGGVDHEDFTGSKGTIETGDLQFMTAGRGIVHAEMPRINEDGSPNVGLQLWVDLPKHLKKCEPRYRDLRAKEIPSVDVDDGKVTVKVISGQSHGVDSVKDLAYTPVWFLDITIRPGGTISQNLPAGWNAFAYIINGTATFGAPPNQQTIAQYHNVVFEQEGDSVIASVDEGASEEARFVLIAGTPLNQEVVQYGPFVLSSQQEIYQVMMDYSTFSNGFERAENWESEIGKRMVH